MRRPAAASKPKPRSAKPYSFPAPVGGWIKNQNLATPGARMPDGSKVNGAYMLENWFPTATGVRMRAGSAAYAQFLDETTIVSSMFAYVNGNNQKMFAVSAAEIFDVTTPAFPTNQRLVDELDDFIVDENGNFLIIQASLADNAMVSGLAGGDWSVIQSATPGGVFLRGVNGVDTPFVFDGTSFDTLPAITGDGLDPKTLSFVWEYKNRLFFVKKDSLSAWYLPAESIGGVAVELPLGGIFSRGGSLLFGSGWSIETGDGLSEKCVFVTTEGEAAVFQGDDPSVAAAWTKVGVYRIGRPIGAKAHIRAGGDLVIATDVGFVPLSQAIQRDLSALSPSAVSFPIETAWNEAVIERSSAAWAAEVWPTKQMVLIALPSSDGQQPQMFAANARTGAWGLFTGWNGKCLQLFRDRLFFGSTGGTIVEAEASGLDLGLPYTSAVVPLFDALKAPASLKTSLLMRAVLRSPSEIIPKLSLQADYSVSLPPVPDAFGVSTNGVWGAGVWGESVWGSPAVKNIYQRWQSVGGSGHAISPGLQLTSGSIVPPDVELVQIDGTYEQGDVVT